MRIPHTIPKESVRAYEPSEPVLGLVAERNRQLQSENWSWDTNALPTLAELVIQFFATNFDHHKEVLPLLNKENMIYFLEILSTSLTLDNAIPYVKDGIYWKRRYKDTFQKNTDVMKYDGSWKRMFLENHIESIVENEEPGYTDWNELKALLRLTSPYVKRLEISHLQPPRVMDSFPEYPDFCNTDYFVPEHLDLSPVLSMLENLEELNLKFSVKDIGMKFKFNYFNVHIKDIERLASGIKCLRNLMVLSITCSDIDDLKLNIILVGLEMCKEFYSLEITYCKITNRGAKALAYFSQLRSSLTFLNLHNNKIESEGAQGLAYVMMAETGCKLKSVDLSFNPIGELGGRFLATALAKNKFFSQINLAGCGLGPEAGEDIANMLMINRSLTRMDLSNNLLGDDVGDMIVDAFRQNYTILQLDVRNCGFTNECVKKIEELTFRNREKVRKSKDSKDSSVSNQRKATPIL